MRFNKVKEQFYAMLDAYMEYVDGVARVSSDKSRSLIVRFVAGIYQKILCLVGLALLLALCFGGIVLCLTLGMLVVIEFSAWFGMGVLTAMLLINVGFIIVLLFYLWIKKEKGD